ncbi:MAG: cell envelope integrity protein TolA, partial [Pseudomonadota bacterium]
KRIEEEKRKAEEAKRKAEDERRKAQDAKRRAEEEDLLRKQMEDEEHRMQQEVERRREEAEQQRILSEVERYQLLIQNKVERNWIRPPDTAKGMKCTVSVNLIPGGEVVGVKIVKSSGNAVFDRSVETSVWQSSPMPVSSDAKVFDKMRTINFVFNPKD